MKDVVAIINLKNKGIINIISSNAKYDRTSHDTLFYNSVNIEYLGNSIICENLDVLFSKNLSKVYNNVVFKNNNLELYTDIILVDLISGDIKLEMIEGSKKVRLKTKYNYVN